MRRLLLLAACVLAPAVSYADIGIGASVRSDPTIYVPIDVSPTFRIEPFFVISMTETSSPGFSQEFENRTFGAGAFLRGDVMEQLQAYFGGRLGFQQSETTTTSGGVSTSSDQDGLMIQPAFGAEAFIGKRFSIAVEALFTISKLENGSETESIGTSTNVLVRAYPFK